MWVLVPVGRLQIPASHLAFILPQSALWCFWYSIKARRAEGTKLLPVLPLPSTQLLGTGHLPEVEKKDRLIWDHFKHHISHGMWDVFALQGTMANPSSSVQAHVRPLWGHMKYGLLQSPCSGRRVTLDVTQCRKQEFYLHAGFTFLCAYVKHFMCTHHSVICGVAQVACWNCSTEGWEENTKKSFPQHAWPGAQLQL